jgi:hypothetical protein
MQFREGDSRLRRSRGLRRGRLYCRPCKAVVSALAHDLRKPAPQPQQPQPLREVFRRHTRRHRLRRGFDLGGPATLTRRCITSKQRMKHRLGTVARGGGSEHEGLSYSGLELVGHFLRHRKLQLHPFKSRPVTAIHSRHPCRRLQLRPAKFCHPRVPAQLWPRRRVPRNLSPAETNGGCPWPGGGGLGRAAAAYGPSRRVVYPLATHLLLWCISTGNSSGERLLRLLLRRRALLARLGRHPARRSRAQQHRGQPEAGRFAEQSANFGGGRPTCLAHPR